MKKLILALLLINTVAAGQTIPPQPDGAPSLQQMNGNTVKRNDSFAPNVRIRLPERFRLLTD